LPAPGRTRRPLPVTLKRFLDDACDLGPLPMKRTGAPGTPCKKKLANERPPLKGAAAGGMHARAITGDASLLARAINCISSNGGAFDVGVGYLVPTIKQTTVRLHKQEAHLFEPQERLPKVRRGSQGRKQRTAGERIKC
jgi:hypothetical protein